MKKRLLYKHLIYPSIHTNVNYHKFLCCCLVLVLVTSYLLYSLLPKNTTTQLQEDIATKIIRFHVIANSNSEEDQCLKLKVKEAVTEELQPELKKAKSVKEAETILSNNLKHLETVANQVIQDNGYTYTAKATLQKDYFPLKVYGDLTLPPGTYQAVRIELGAASGQNWWCIMYPPLCFVDATYSIVPDSSKKQLKYVLTDEEYDSVFHKKKVTVKVKFKIFTWLNKYFD